MQFFINITSIIAVEPQNGVLKQVNEIRQQNIVVPGLLQPQMKSNVESYVEGDTQKNIIHQINYVGGDPSTQTDYSKQNSSTYSSPQSLSNPTQYSSSLSANSYQQPIKSQSQSSYNSYTPQQQNTIIETEPTQQQHKSYPQNQNQYETPATQTTQTQYEDPIIDYPKESYSSMSYNPSHLSTLLTQYRNSPNIQTTTHISIPQSYAPSPTSPSSTSYLIHSNSYGVQKSPTIKSYQSSPSLIKQYMYQRMPFNQYTQPSPTNYIDNSSSSQSSGANFSNIY